MLNGSFACPDGILRLGFVRSYYPAFYYDDFTRFRAERNSTPFDGSLGMIERGEIFTDVTTDDLDNLQWSQFRALQPIEFDFLDFYQAVPHNQQHNWQPLDHFIVVGPAIFILVLVSYIIVSVLNHVSKVIGAGSFSIIRGICSSIFMISFTVLLFAYSAGFQQNSIVRKLPNALDFGDVRDRLENGDMEWIAAEASEVQAPWLDKHPLFVEPDFTRKITRVCTRAGSSVTSFFRSEWPEIYRIQEIMKECSLNRVLLNPRSSYVDVVGISEMPFPYFFIFNRRIPLREFDRLNQILLRIYSADFRAGFLMRRYLKKQPRSQSAHSSSSQSAPSFIALSLSRLILLIIFLLVACLCSIVVFLLELTILPRLPKDAIQSTTQIIIKRLLRTKEERRMRRIPF